MSNRDPISLRPPDASETAADDLRAQFFEVLHSGYERDDGIEGICEFRLLGSKVPDFYVNVGGTLTFGEGRHQRPTTTVSLPVELLQRMLSDAHGIDFRAPEIMSRISIEGDERLATLLGNLLKRPASDIAERLEHAEEKARNADPITRIERLRAPVDRVIRQAIHTGKPIIVTNAIEHWPARSWRLDDWKRTFGATVLRVKSASSSETMRDFVEAMERADHTGASYSNGVVLPRATWTHFIPPFFGGIDAFESPQIWMGTAAAGEPVTHLHRDGLTGFLFHLWGRKKFLLYSPDQAELLYPFRRYNQFQPCWVRPAAPNYERYPLFRMARPLEIVLEPGELLVNPAGWFHEVYALDPVISVSFFLKEASNNE